MNKEQKKMNNKGFSLVELIVVIAIMAILVGVLAPQYVRYVAKSRISTDMQNAQAMKTAIEAYAAESGISTAITITINDTDKAIKCNADSTILSAAGIAASTPLKGAWTNTGTYVLGTDLKWTSTNDPVATNNGKQFHMKSIFDASQASETTVTP